MIHTAIRIFMGIKSFERQNKITKQIAPTNGYTTKLIRTVLKENVV